MKFRYNATFSIAIGLSNCWRRGPFQRGLSLREQFSDQKRCECILTPDVLKKSLFSGDA